MFRKQKIFLPIMFSAFLLLIACSTPTPKVIIPANFPDTANLIAQNLITGLGKQDYVIFTRDFDDNMLKALPSTAMTELHKLIWNQNGNYQSLEFQKVYEEKGFIITFFNLVFEKGNLDMQLVFTPNPPFKLSGLWFPPK